MPSCHHAIMQKDWLSMQLMHKKRHTYTHTHTHLIIHCTFTWICFFEGSLWTTLHVLVSHTLRVLSSLDWRTHLSPRPIHFKSVMRLRGMWAEWMQERDSRSQILTLLSLEPDTSVSICAHETGRKNRRIKMISSIKKTKHCCLLSHSALVKITIQVS